MSDRYMSDWQTFLRNRYEEIALSVEDAYKAGTFDIIKELKIYNNGIQEAYFKTPDEVYEYFKRVRIVKFYPWEVFCYEDGIWSLETEFHFKFQQKRKRKKNKISPSNRERVDNNHRKIKGEKTKSNVW